MRKNFYMWLPGMLHGNAKTDFETAEKAREMYRSTPLTCKEVGAALGLSGTTIQRIVTYKAYAKDSTKLHESQFSEPCSKCFTNINLTDYTDIYYCEECWENETK